MGKEEYGERTNQNVAVSAVRVRKVWLVMFKPLTRLLTRNLHEIPLVFLNFDYQKYKTDGSEGSCMIHIHESLKDDEYITNAIKDLCNYIRENYDMEKIL